MKKISLYLIFFLAFIAFPAIASAAVQCNSNATPSLQLGNPACWTVSGSAGYYTYNTINCVWDCGYPLYICGKPQYFSYSDNGDSCGKYSSMCYDNCGNGDCQNSGIKDGSSNGTKTVSTWHDGTISYTCYYTTVATWGAPAADGRRVASSVTQKSTSGTGCVSASNVSYVNAAPVVRVNGSAGPTSVYRSGDINVSWSSTYATSCTGTGFGWSTTALSGTSATISARYAPANSNFTLTCTNPGGVPVSATVNLTVINNPNPIVTLVASPNPLTNLNNNSRVVGTKPTTLTWTITNAALSCGSGCTCSLTGPSGTLGGQSYPTQNTYGTSLGSGSHNFSVTCVNSIGGSGSANTVVTTQCSPPAPWDDGCNVECGDGQNPHHVMQPNCTIITTNPACSMPPCPVSSDLREVKP